MEIIANRRYVFKPEASVNSNAVGQRFMIIHNDSGSVRIRVETGEFGGREFSVSINLLRVSCTPYVKNKGSWTSLF